ncbi:hypothetical protein TrVE_jg2840 [Triparma verrucosa]|uniref:RRM domain-containing protein n=1 Tax=Triparma verrucosa TaxID=1606542 RepID=A0A9W7BHK4_9STRA|nr:hypothetical protein TrVE_jg2840 [Triparma verrucosa]
MRVSRRGSKLRGQDFSVSKLNEERKSNAGKKGGAGYVDPNKLFVGNLAFSVTEDQLLSWFESKGYGTHVSSCKIIRDWKTGDSKGYAFASFTDPIFATSAMESLTNHELEGRIVRISQGQRKRTEAEVAFVTKDRRNAGDLTEEDLAIQSGLLEAGDDEGEIYDDEVEYVDKEGDYDGEENIASTEFKGFGQFVNEDLNIDEWVAESETETGADGSDDEGNNESLLRW